MREVRSVLYAHNMPPLNSYSYYPPDSLCSNHYVLLKSFCRGRWRWAHRDAALVCHRNHPANVWRLPFYLPHWHRLQLNAPLSSPSPRGLSLTTLRHLSERKKNEWKESFNYNKKKPVFERRKSSDGAEFFSVSCPLFHTPLPSPTQKWLTSASPYRSFKKTSLRKKIKKSCRFPWSLCCLWPPILPSTRSLTPPARFARRPVACTVPRLRLMKLSQFLQYLLTWNVCSH